ncbi:MAG: MBOAT family protein [Clostridiaceae bacterium]|mgnify:FL=1|nr:MBOAT family protein [Clostridiaceae bacterium]
MVFSSSVFLFVFLPLVFLLYKVSPSKIKNTILIVFSLIFYAWGEPLYVLLMLLSVAVNYALAIGIDTGEPESRRKPRYFLLIMTIVFNIGMLFVFKYSNFFVDNFNSIMNLKISIPTIRLPIGISFFTFQAMSYTIDVYRGGTKAQKNPLNILLYISFFPQLIAGPIVLYSDIEQQIQNRVETSEKTVAGIKRFVIGLSKKMLLANTFGAVADQIFALDVSGINIAVAWLGAITYALQIYFDFSGYSDMAIGLAKLFGFELKENFDYPYTADSIKNFWRRWHISLSGWFKDYLYIPLGGNRRGTLRTAVNLLIVFFCTGIWHGAQWTFVVWGFYHGFFIMLERVGIIRPERFKIPGLARIYTLLVVITAFVIFRASTIQQGLIMIGKMFVGWHLNDDMIIVFSRIMSPYLVVVLLIGFFAATPWPKNWAGRLAQRLNRRPILVELSSMLVTLMLFIVCVLSLSSAAYNPFIYFRF